MATLTRKEAITQIQKVLKVYADRPKVSGGILFSIFPALKITLQTPKRMYNKNVKREFHEQKNDVNDSIAG